MQKQHAGTPKATEKHRSASSPLQPEQGSVTAHASDAGDSDQPPRPAKRPRKKQVATEQVGRSPSVELEDGEDTALCVTPIQVEQLPHLKNWKRWAAVKDGLRLKRLVVGKIPSIVPAHLDTLLSSEAIEGRQWQIDSPPKLVPNAKLTKGLFSDASKVTSDYWTVVLTNGAIKAQEKGVVFRTACLPVELLAADDMQIVKRFARELCHLLNHLPIAKVSLKPGDPAAQVLTFTALQRAKEAQGDLASLLYQDVLSQAKVYGFGITWETRRSVYQVDLGLFDGGLQPHKASETRIRLKPTDVGEAKAIPAVPDALIAFLPAPKYPDSVDITTLSAKERATHAKALQLCRYVQFIMYGACGAKDALVRQAYTISALYKSSVVGKKHWTDRDINDVYDGSRLWKFERMQTGKRVEITVAKAIADDVKNGSVTRVNIVGLSKGRLSTVMEEILQEFMTGSNILDAFQAGMLKADKVNTMPAWKSFALSCDHVGEERESAVHICQNCNDITFCHEMRYSSDTDLRVCLHCEHKALKRDLSDYTETTPRGKPGKNLRHKLLKLLQREYPGSAKQSIAARTATATQLATKWLDPTSGDWNDAYVNAKRPDVAPKPDGTRTTAFLASADAAHPFHVEGGKVSYHHDDNLAPCAGYVNQGLNTWLKGNLQVVKDAQALRDSLDYSAYADVSIRFDHYWAIRGKYPHRRSTRLEIEMDDHQFERCRGEWQKGVLADPRETVYYTVPVPWTFKPTWTRSDQERYDGLIKQMAARKAGPVELPRGNDGAPFPWRPEHKPSDWSWALLEGHMAYHFELMDEWCDRLFTTEECPETIFLEVLWQWFDNGGRDPFLRLPMTVFARHATAWALGHLHHGQPMRTGWPLRVRITDISQRDALRCNVLVEPRIGNYMKMDFPEAEYQLMLEDLLYCKEETEWFCRPQGPLPPLKLQRSKPNELLRSMQWVSSGSQAQDDADDDLIDEVDAGDLADDFDEDEAVLGESSEE
ncbi:hypothetical protein B0A55_09245 [Friedmanniomyces simplex]|uniref:Uncharacterized protein n=1 Tax=Friedmanniomyces simplex TaxID=329884 RepID=A0A4U0XV30_9PEZI|nr:hypothetical protein B0A55_09245 [Friedmanniomyces simplex]